VEKQRLDLGISPSDRKILSGRTDIPTPGIFSTQSPDTDSQSLEEMVISGAESDQLFLAPLPKFLICLRC
jgi:hypothetical protein